jgi:hypothetical protein
MATSISSPMKPRNSLPASPANSSTWIVRITNISPRSSRGSARAWPVRASTATCFRPVAAVGESPIVTNQTVSSSGSCDTYMPTLDGKRAVATAITWSSVTRGASARIFGDTTSVPSHCPIW